MKSIKFKRCNVEIGKSQSEYITLSAEIREDEVITKWRLNLWERIRVLFTGNLYLSLLTFKKPVQPIKFAFKYPYKLFQFYKLVNGEKKNFREVSENRLTEKDKKILRDCNVDYECDDCKICREIMKKGKDEEYTKEELEIKDKLNILYHQMKDKKEQN